MRVSSNSWRRLRRSCMRSAPMSCAVPAMREGGRVWAKVSGSPHRTEGKRSMTPRTAELELVVEQLDCADEAAQIQAALGRLAGVHQVRTSVSARKAVVTYDPSQVNPLDVQGTIERLGMTVREGRTPTVARHTSLPNLLGGVFVTAVALVALIGILGERLGLLDAVTARMPPWLAMAAVLLGGLPIFHNVLR